MDSGGKDCCEQIDQLLSLPQQMWLLGAGVSKDAGVPLMQLLTERVQAKLTGDELANYRAIREDVREGANVEDVLSQIGDLLSLTLRNRTGECQLGERGCPTQELEVLHSVIQAAIRDIVRSGYRAAEDDRAEEEGTLESPIVSVEGHVAFVDALFSVRRAGLEKRPPVAFFTTNYDTLLEDALALSRISYCDGFCGGAMGFWEPSSRSLGFRDPLATGGGDKARVYKLHGSIDWYVSEDFKVTRRREGAGYPRDSADRLLIYPQATKYVATQKDPFATLFSAFRHALRVKGDTVLAICGYSFGDEHINSEIEHALKEAGNSLTVLAFVKQSDVNVDGADAGLPSSLAEWLRRGDEEWPERVIVAGSRGVFRGSLDNQCPATAEKPHDWWTFSGLTSLLQNGPEVS